MPYLSGPSKRSGRLRLLAVATAALGAFLGSAGTLLASPATALPSGASALTLTEQTTWLSGRAHLSIGLAISSPFPDSDLGIRLRVYGCLTSRSAFEGSLSPSAFTGSTPIDDPRTIPLANLRPTETDDVRSTVISDRAFGAATASPGTLAHPNLDLVCANGGSVGVYPLTVSLVSTSNGAVLSSFVTHLVYTSSPSTTPLRTVIVVPLGASPALRPASPTSRLEPSSIRHGQAAALAGVTTVMRQATHVPLSLELFPQLVLGLSRSSAPLATAALDKLRALLASGADELVRAPFADVDPASLAGTGLGSEFNAQLARAAPTLSSILGARALDATFVATGNLNATALRLLQSDGVRDLVLPETSYSLDGALASGLTQTAPFVLAAGSTGASLVAAGADPKLASFFSEQSDPVLSAENLLTDLAQIYFDRPNADQARGVVVAPTSWTPDETFLNALVSGLRGSPILRAVTLGGLFRSVPVGANGDVAGATLLTNAPVPGAAPAAVRAALGKLELTKRVVPDDVPLLAGLRDSILVGESEGISAQDRQSYLNAPVHSLAEIGATLSFGGGTTISLTEQHARLPITILSASNQIVHATMVLESSELLFQKGGARSALVLSHKDNPEYVPVTARTSGTSSLSATLVAPGGGSVLLHTTFTVRSTAFSAVAIGISVVALIILAIWWFRSVARHRRRVRAGRGAAPSRADDA